MSDFLMKMASGKLVDALALRPEDICLDDIFTGLSRQCRYNGQAPVCVAQHSLGVRKLLFARGEPLIVQLRGLMHDALEAYIPDVIRPHKRRIASRGYNDIESLVLTSIWMPLGLGDPEIHFSPAIHKADTDMCHMEGDYHFPNGVKDWQEYCPDVQETIDRWRQTVLYYLRSATIRGYGWYSEMRDEYNRLRGLI